MGQGIRVIVVNTDEEVASDLRAVLLSVDGVRIVAEVDEPALLAQALGRMPAEVLLVHLDPNPAGMMDVVAPLIETYRGQFAAIAMTENRDAELVMRAMRIGMKEFLWKPFPPEQLGEILQRMGREATGDGRRLGRLIVVVGTSGGVGATQLATNVAVELAQLENWGTSPNPGTRPRAALVDMDFRFGQVAMQLDAQPTYTIAELCETPEQIDLQMIDRAVFKHGTGVHVLARPADLAQAERISAGQAAGVLAALQEHYDFVVVDLRMHDQREPTERGREQPICSVNPRVQRQVIKIGRPPHPPKVSHRAGHPVTNHAPRPHRRTVQPRGHLLVLPVEVVGPDELVTDGMVPRHRQLARPLCQRSPDRLRCLTPH